MKYEIELWSRQGVLLADITPLVKGFSYVLTRNDAEQIRFSLDLDNYEQLCESIGASPTGILSPYQTDVKVKRNGVYKFGTHVGYVSVDMTEDQNTIEVRAFGYLNLLIDRYITANYDEVDSVDIAWDLITQTQAQENGSMGMTLGPNQINGPLRTRTYIRQNIKEAILGLAILDDSFDVKFDHNRKFNTYASSASGDINPIEFFYPGNIRSVSVPRDGIQLFNKIYGLGSGFGEEALETMIRDEASQLNYGVHEDIQVFNNDDNLIILDEDTQLYLDYHKNILELPQMSVSGDDFDLNQFDVGNRVNVRITGHPFLATVDGIYRIEKLDVTVDENEAEDIKIYFDDFGVSQS